MGSTIVDPFCGCGTTLIGAQQLGYESYGFDINPISVLVSRVKTRPYNSSQISAIESHLGRIMSLTIRSASDEPPALKIIDKVFHPTILDALLVLRRYLKSVEDQTVENFLKVGWLSILERVSNVFKEGNGIKYRNRKRTPQGYITIPDEEWQARLFPDDKFNFVLHSFHKQIKLMLDDLSGRMLRPPKATVIEDDSTTLSSHIPSNTAAYVVFSPPYCNCFNYFKIFKIELWMGGFVHSYKDIQQLNRRALRSHVETRLERPNDAPNRVVDQFVELIDTENLWDKRIPRAIRGYFMDMKNTLREVNTILKPGGNCVIVVGNSAYSGIVVPTDALLAKISNNVGFKVNQIAIARHLTTSSQQKLLLNRVRGYLRESLVCLTKPDPRLEEKELRVVEEFPLQVKLSTDTVFVIRNNGLTELTHKFHRYPGKFIPHVPRWAMRKYLENRVQSYVLDPFCGSGTSNLEAIRLGHCSFGMDIDDISRLLTKVKTTPISASRLDRVVKEVLPVINSRRKASFRPTIGTLEHWFGDRAIQELGIIRDVIDECQAEPDIFDFLLVCFMAVIRRASNADNQTMKTYVSHTRPKDPESARQLFNSVLPDYANRLKRLGEELQPGSRSTLLPYTDARKFAAEWQADGFPMIDLIITSPPYLKTVDYVYNQMAEYFWMGDLFGMETQPKQNTKKREYIGTEKVYVSEYQDFVETGIPDVDELSARVWEKDPKHSFVISNYFRDMQKHFEEARRILKSDSHYVIVVGDCLVNNEVVPVQNLIQQCGELAGFSQVGLFGYEIRNRHMRFPRRGRGGIIRYDWVIDFELSASNGE